MAFYTAKLSEVILVANSLGFISSNQPISYFNIDLKYSFLKRMPYFSPVIIQVDIYTQLNRKEIPPITVNHIACIDALSTTSSGVEVGEKESVTSPKIRAKAGAPKPLIIDDINPNPIKILSVNVAKWNNF